MPGDLNLKKSWHPGLAKNKQKVRMAEEAIIEKRQHEAAYAAEIEKAREIKEIKDLQEPARINEWMYAGVDKSGVGNSNDLEQLIKKKRTKKTKSKSSIHREAKPIAQAQSKKSPSTQDARSNKLHPHKTDSSKPKEGHARTERFKS